MEGGNWKEGRIGKRIGMIRCGERQERWLDGHENEWKSSTVGGEEVKGIFRTRQKPGVTLAVTQHIGDIEPEEASSCSQTRTPVE